MMNLDDTQKKQIAAWIAEGLKLSEIQKRIESDFGLRLTYMEARFLLDDLALAPKDPEVPEADKVADSLDGPVDEGTLPEDSAPVLGGVKITVDQLVRSGALISGEVTFSDAKKAAWYLDQYGRLGLVPEEKSAKPSESDLKEFQTQLQSLLEKSAY